MAAHDGPVTPQAGKDPGGGITAARYRDRPSPLLDPHPHPVPCAPMNASDSSAMYRDSSRLVGSTVVFANVASR